MTGSSISIDGGIFFGVDPTTGRGETEGGCLDRLAPYGVDMAIASPFRAAYFDMQEGNDAFLDMAQADPRIIPAPLINPVSYDADEDYLAKLYDRGVRIIGLFPGFYFDAWNWHGYAVERLVKDAASLGLSVLTGVTSSTDIACIARSLAPTGATILVRWMRGGGYVATADMVAVGRAFPNMYFDIGTTTQSGGIEHLAERLGARRLFVASNAPLSHEGCAHLLLKTARLSGADREMIVGGTLAKLLDVALPSNESLQDASRDESAWKRLIEQPKIDTHWHTSGWNIVEPRLGFDQMCEEFDRFNYRIAVTSSVRALNDDLEAGNDETRAFCDKDPRVRGHIVVNPLQIDRSLREIDRLLSDPRFVSVKTIQDFYGLSLDDAAYEPILDHAARHELTVMAHMGGMAEAARRHPDLRFIASHGTWRPTEFADLPNVYMDIATSTALHAQVDLDLLLESVGVDRIIFSCDGQLMSPAWTLGKLASSNLPDSVIDAMMTANPFRALPRLSKTVDMGSLESVTAA